MLAISVLNQTTNFVQGIFYKVFTQKLLISEGLSNLCYALSSIVYMFAGILSTNIYQTLGFQQAALALILMNTVSYLLVFISGQVSWAFALTIIFTRTNTGM